MSLTKEEREKLEKARKEIDDILKKDEKKNKEPEWVDYGSRERREW